MGERSSSQAKNDRWLPAPTQFPVNGQWWSNSATHLDSRGEILDVFLDEDVVDVVEVICVVSESVDNILENLLHTAQCLDRSGFCIMHVEQKVSLKN